MHRFAANVEIIKLDVSVAIMADVRHPELVTIPDPAATLSELEALANDPTIPLDRQERLRKAVELVEIACHTAACWGGKRNAEVRADVLMPSTVRGTGATGRNALVEALNELVRRCAP